VGHCTLPTTACATTAVTAHCGRLSSCVTTCETQSSTQLAGPANSTDLVVLGIAVDITTRYISAALGNVVSCIHPRAVAHSLQSCPMLHTQLWLLRAACIVAVPQDPLWTAARPSGCSVGLGSPRISSRCPAQRSPTPVQEAVSINQSIDDTSVAMRFIENSCQPITENHLLGCC
jgi:hypothetical protein